MAVDTLDAAMARPAGSYRIVRIQSRMVVGGPAWNVINLSAGLKSDYPTLVLTGGVEPGEADLTNVARARGVDVIAIPELGRAVSPANDTAALLRIRALLRHLKPDIVHTHTAKAGAVGRLAAALANVPVRLHTFHGHVFHRYFGPVTTQGVISVERTLARMSTRIVAISERQAYDLGVRFRIAPPEKIVTIPLGLQLDRFIHMPRDARAVFRRDVDAGDRPVITIIGRLVPIKNHDLFLAAAAHMIRAGSNALFVIVGGGAQEERLKVLAAELGISAHVRFLGYRADLEHIYAGSDVVALTSHNEGTPVAILEALAAGVHVVATNVGGVADVLGGLSLATMVPAGDAEALAAALMRVGESPMEPQPNHPDAVAIRRRYGVRRLVDDMRTLYDELVPSAPRGWRRSA